MGLPLLMRPFTVVLVELVLASLLQLNSSTTNGGSISGTVTDDAGTPIADLKISAERPGDPQVIRSTRSDPNGRFRLEIDFGKYRLFATDEHSNYGDCNLAIFLCDIPEVEISPASPAASVVVKARKAARVQGTIKDPAKGDGISDATIVFRRGDDFFRGYNSIVNSTFSCPVPAGVDLTFSVIANKYRQWIYRSPKTDYATFRLAQGETMVINVEMVRVDP
jgi:hypothetical protein